MTRIRMMETITGGRYDGRPWPAIHETIHVPEWEAMELVRARHAVYEEDPVLAEPAPEAPPAQEDFGGEASASDSGGEVSGSDSGGATSTAEVTVTDDGSGAEPGSEVPEGGDVARPAVNQPKAAWVAWAVAQGADPVAAEAMTKADLMSEYGSRL